MKKENIILSLGGSLVAPDKIDLDFLKKFQSLILSQLTGRRFYIYIGGGKIARVYQQALSEFGATDEEKDWAGIGASRLNAQVVKQVFNKLTYPKVVTDPSKKIQTTKDIVVGGAWKPGRSTDYGSVLLAKNAGAKILVNLSNIDYVYDKDPNKFSDAKPIKEITWPEFRKLLPDKWSPGLSSPFDPEASKIAQKLKLKVVVINGRKLKELDNFLDNKSFVGTIIK